MAVLVLMQHSAEFTEYDDQIGEQYHYPSQYFERIVEGARFVYCRPQEGHSEVERRQSKTGYFGTGTIGSIRQDITKEGHRYCQIEDYFEFPNEVSYRDIDGTYLETGTSQIPVMQSAVRVIDDEAFQRIILRSGLDQMELGLFRRLQTAKNEGEQIRALNEAYKSASPRMRQYLASRVERGAAIGGKVKALNGHICQVCRSPPFMTRTGRPYAEAHHLTPLHRLEPGSLASQNVICVCANCHRKMHYGNVEFIAADAQSMTFEIDGVRIKVKRNVL
jgi:predicted HNH restriction endonuclease